MMAVQVSWRTWGIARQKSNPTFMAVWVIELGRWDIRNALNKGEDHKAKFDRYVDKGIYRILKSIGEKEFDDIDEPVRQVILIFDMEGYGIEQLQSLPGKIT